MSSLKPYRGTQRKLVLAFDVGTTFSGISYAILDPGEIPTIQNITSYPGQENSAADSKIPSILYYNPDGTVHAVGAEAATPGVALDAEDEGLVFVEWFKLHLRSDTLDTDNLNKSTLPPLPQGKTVVQVFADFMSYLYSCARRRIIEIHASGESLWSSLEERIDFVLSHPNGWEGAQQQKMRQAAILGGLVPDSRAGRSRIHFVKLACISVLRMVSHVASLYSGQTVMVIDAGGGTIDISSYRFLTVSPTSVEEITEPDCILEGSISINQRAHTLLHEKLKNSPYGNEEDIKTMLENFDKHRKWVFKSSLEPSCINSHWQAMKSLHSLYLPLQPLSKQLNDNVSTVTPSLTASTSVTRTVFLVGGFAANPWLFSELQRLLQQIGLHVSRPDRHTSKAVAEGAVAFYLEEWVSARVARVTYGVQCLIPYHENDPEHLARRASVVSRPSGKRMIPDAFRILLSRGGRIHENGEVYQELYKEAREKTALNKISTEITCYRGKSKNPGWLDTEPEMFSCLCTVHADTSRILRIKRNGPKGTYFSQEFKVVLLCGLTELKAQISWMENGREMRGPAIIVYDDDAQALN
ncbi:uncharacterized protein FIBRA_06835 [Fibroporia radiculosa]|uniref:Uncharacterized protein n=1 Tax=Fibroporia radiculosa TaxID=599839 RepID=J4IBH1_9APHY|nr:uncharacterized protein FIBRA_06835 [Fibroporia radiculosa]CCM04651.1 predicted protein [Fibroporia radiculosa]